MSYYPPGAEHDPRAPYNQPEGEECPDCAGTGETERCVADDGSYDPEPCPRCGGTRFIAPPTREEIEEIKAEQRFDQMRDEGEI